MFSARRGFDEDEQRRLGAAIDAIYDDFVGKVARGRGRTRAEIEAVARGRVWTGRDALAAGLVDSLGGLRDAVDIARSRAGLPDDAPVRPAVHLGPLARLGRPKNSADPRAGLGPVVPRMADLAGSLGLSARHRPADAAAATAVTGAAPISWPASSTASTGTPSPVRSPRATARPVIAWTRERIGPLTSGPLPCDQSVSVATSRTPTIRSFAPINRLEFL